MSASFTYKSGEADGHFYDMMPTNDGSKYKRYFRGSACWVVAAAVALGLLLLTLILVAHNTRAINNWESQYEKQMQDGILQLEIHLYNLTKELGTQGRQYSALTASQNTLQEVYKHNLNITEMLKEMATLQSQYKTVIASRDKLQEEVNRLKVNVTEKTPDKTCLSGWTKYNNKCYYVSSSGGGKTWEASRKACQDIGGDLVIITSAAELNFVKRFHGVAWIGLKRGPGDKWMWVDETELQGSGFWQSGEPNNADGEEDCVEVSRSASAWNDVPCDRKFSWVCED